MQKQRTYYAIEHTHGADTCDQNGDHIGEVHDFLLRSQRESWVGNSHCFFTKPGFRTILNSCDNQDRRAIDKFLRTQKET